MRFLSVCSGIEAASVAWAPLGWSAVAFSEIEPFPCAVLAHHYPNTPNWGDMTKFKEWPDVSIGLLCGGTPCQSFSVAGLRKGLDDPRGNLMLTFGAIAAKYRPKWLVWENVPGVLSSENGRDFASFLGLLTGQEIQVPAGGWQNSGVIAGIDSAYGIAWRVLDAQYFGVAQRRRRVFVVGCLGDWRSAAAVLFERHSMQGHPAPSRKAGQGTAADVAPSLVASGRGVERTGETRGQDPVVAVAHVDVMPTIRAGAANGGAGHGARSGDSKDELIVPVVTHSLRGEGFDASEDGTGRGTPLIPVATLCVATGQAGAEIAPTLNCNHEAPYAVYAPDVAATMVARSSRGGGQTNSPGHQADKELIVTQAAPVAVYALGMDVAPTLDQRAGRSVANTFATSGGLIPVAAQPYTLALRGRDGMPQLEYRQDGTANALLTPNGGRGGIGVGAIAFAQIQRDEAPYITHIPDVGSTVRGATTRIDSDCTDTLIASGIAIPINDMATRHAGTDGSGNQNGKGHGLGIGGESDPMFTLTKGDKHAVAHSFSNRGIASDVPETLRAASHGAPPMVSQSMSVRRLTPTECERLMGFPDGYTLITMRGKPAADGPRYKSLGNSWATSNVRWIGERIQAVDQLNRAQAAINKEAITTTRNAP